MGYLLDGVYWVIAVLSAPLWMRKKRGGWDERFARIETLPSSTKTRVLLHAVSVGEVNALRPLVPLLEENYDLVICVTTDTGTERAKMLFEGRAHIVRYPLDFSKCVRRFLDAVQPKAVALVELELWPNFVGECRKRNIPVGVINGRLSSRSFRGYLLARPLFGWTFGRLAFCAVQDDTYARRFRWAGARKRTIKVTGQMKWDIASVDIDETKAEELARRFGIDRTRPLIVAGSTAPGEHQLLHESVPPDVQLLCAPRREEWFSHAADELGRCMLYSRTDRAILSGDTLNRYLLDTIGLLSLAYWLADIVVIGRSFEKYHGSDPMEPASLGKPVIIGPYHEDFEVTVGTLVEGGAAIVTDSEHLRGEIGELLGDPERRERMGQRGLECVRQHQGASERNVRLIREALRQSRA
ncbi:MAG: 3-deoxy-D-manno-octulosonic acid transferase [Planctomycetota bacterium]|jgi:3-deoxy-D-manno-octulosonic-acid transferase